MWKVRVWRICCCWRASVSWISVVHPPGTKMSERVNGERWQVKRWTPRVNGERWNRSADNRWKVKDENRWKAEEGGGWKQAAASSKARRWEVSQVASVDVTFHLSPSVARKKCEVKGERWKVKSELNRCNVWSKFTCSLYLNICMFILKATASTILLFHLPPFSEHCRLSLGFMCQAFTFHISLTQEERWKVKQVTTTMLKSLTQLPPTFCAHIFMRHDHQNYDLLELGSSEHAHHMNAASVAFTFHRTLCFFYKRWKVKSTDATCDTSHLLAFELAAACFHPPPSSAFHL